MREGILDKELEKRGHYSDKPPYAERHVRWCERTVKEIIPHLLLDFRGYLVIKISCESVLFAPVARIR